MLLVASAVADGCKQLLECLNSGIRETCPAVTRNSNPSRAAQTTTAPSSRSWLARAPFVFPSFRLGLDNASSSRGGSILQVQCFKTGGPVAGTAYILQGEPNKRQVRHLPSASPSPAVLLITDAPRSVPGRSFVRFPFVPFTALFMQDE